MSSISKKPDDWDFAYLELCTARRYDRSEDKVAHNYGCNSPQELYSRLNAVGFQLCKYCGVRSTDPFHCK